MKATRLRLIPAPETGTLTADEARAWLEEWAPEYLSVLAFGFDSEDPSSREAFGQLAVDVRHMLEACCAAAEGQPVRIQNETEELELPEVARELAQINGARPRHSGGPFEDVYDLLGQRLVSLLSRRAA